MKKLFTFLVLLTCFLGAKAVTKVDYECDYTTATSWSHGWLNESEHLTFEEGVGLHFTSTEAKTNFYDYQYQLHPGIQVDNDASYTITLRIKGTVGQDIHASFSGSNTPGMIPITTDWADVVLENCVNDPNAQYFASSGSLLIQPGDYVGEFWISYIKITHEEAEEKPVQWSNLLTNGDAEGEYGNVACAYAKEFVAGAETQPEPYPATIETLNGNKVFVVHAKEVTPPIVFEEDTNLWGTDYKAGDPKPDNAWQNQFWITLPEGIAAGTQLKVSFKVKASKPGLKADLQTHYWPGDYLGGFTPGTIDIGTDWAPYEAEFTVPNPNDEHKEKGQFFQSIAFNLGVNNQYKEDIDFYFDDLEISEMVLDHGFFVASSNAANGLEYDFENAVECEWDASEDAYVATIGTVGKESTWVNELMISTVRGNTKAFKAAALKPAGSIKANGYELENWQQYTTGTTGYKIALPAAGVWKVYVADPEDEAVILFDMIEGEAAPEPVAIVTNTEVLTIEGVERQDLKDNIDNGNITVREEADDPNGEVVGGEGHEGQTWDNQFFLVANRVLKGDEVTIIEFDYVATAEAECPTGTHAAPGDYRKNAFDNFTFTTTEQHLKVEYTVPAKDWGGNDITDAQSISFDLAVIKPAANYTIKNVKWYLKGDENEENKTLENLIDATGTKNFKVKVGAGNAVVDYGTTGIFDITNTITTGSDVIYNLSGQRVSKDYKGVVIKNGKKVIQK